MADANVAEVKFRANSDVTATWVNGKLQFQFRDNTVMSFNPHMVATSNRSRAELHGWEQRLRDSMALERDNYPDKKVPMADKKAALRRLIDHYHGGSTEWSPAAQRLPAITMEMVVLALSRVYGKDEAAAKGMVASLARKRGIDEDAAMKVWADADKIKKEIVVIRSERAAQDAPSADDLAAELEEEDETTQE